MHLRLTLLILQNPLALEGLLLYLAISWAFPRGSSFFENAEDVHTIAIIFRIPSATCTYSDTQILGAFRRDQSTNPARMLQNGIQVVNTTVVPS